MKVKGIKIEKTNVEIEVSPEELLSSLQSFIFSKLDLSSDYYLKEIEGKKVICETEEYHTSHSWTSEEIKISCPNKRQVEALELFTQLKALLNGIEK